MFSYRLCPHHVRHTQIQTWFFMLGCQQMFSHLFHDYITWTDQQWEHLPAATGFLSEIVICIDCPIRHPCLLLYAFYQK